MYKYLQIKTLFHQFFFLIYIDNSSQLIWIKILKIICNFCDIGLEINFQLKLCLVDFFFFWKFLNSTPIKNKSLILPFSLFSLCISRPFSLISPRDSRCFRSLFLIGTVCCHQCKIYKIQIIHQLQNIALCKSSYIK